MANFANERVLSVHHWNDTLFSFRTTRDAALRFQMVTSVMIGLPVDGKPPLRAYSIASPNHEEYLEFLSIKVQNGPLTSRRLQHLKVGDELIVGRKPVGTLVIDDLKPGKRLFLFSTGTGLAPFMSIIQDPETMSASSTSCSSTASARSASWPHADFIEKELPAHEYLGELVNGKLLYYPTVTREPFRNQGRLTDLLETGKLCEDLRPAPCSTPRPTAP